MEGRDGRYFSTSVVLILMLMASVSITEANLPNQSPQVADLRPNTVPGISVDTDDSPISISGDTQLEAFGLDGYGNETHPYIIDNVHITNNTGTTQIQIEHTTHWVRITHSIVSNGTNGIWLNNVTNVIIDNVTATLNSENGIKVTGSENITVKESEMTHNGYACSEMMLDYHSGSGGLFNPSSNLVVVNNTISHNYLTGLIVKSATNMSILGNTIEDNGGSCVNSESIGDYHSGQGIDMIDSTDIDVNYNSFIHNKLYGFAVAGTSSVDIALNNFFFNGFSFEISQALDDADVDFAMNFWDDFDPETTGYVIDGSANSTDSHPCNATVKYGDTTCDSAVADEDTPTEDTDENGLPVEFILPAVALVVIVAIVVVRRKYRSA